MKIGFLYTSFTGNNVDLALRIEYEMKKIDPTIQAKHILIQTETNKLFKKETLEYEDFDAYVIGSFTINYNQPAYLDLYLKNYPIKYIQNKFVLTFNAHSGSPGCTQKHIAQLIDQKNAFMTEHISIKYCSNYYNSDYAVYDNEIKSVDARQFVQIQEKVNTFMGYVQALNYYKKPKLGFFKQVKSFFAESAADWKISIVPYLYVNQFKCNQCKKCVNNCPANCFKIDQNGRVQLQNVNYCMCCFGCFQMCEQKAILYRNGGLDQVLQYKFNRMQLGEDDQVYDIHDIQRRHQENQLLGLEFLDVYKQDK